MVENDYIGLPPSVTTLSGVTGAITLVAGSGITITPNIPNKTITIAGSGGGGVTTMGSFGSSANANGATISGTTLTLQPASGSFPGGVTTGTQTLAGAKTFTSIVTVPTGGVSSPAVKVAGENTGMYFNGSSNVSFATSGVLVGSFIGTGLSIDRVDALTYNTMRFYPCANSIATAFAFQHPSAWHFNSAGPQTFMNLSPTMVSDNGNPDFYGLVIDATMTDDNGGGTATALQVNLVTSSTYGYAQTIQRWLTDSAEIATLNQAGTFSINQVVVGAFQFTSSPSSGYVLTSDSSGTASWQIAPGATYSFSSPLSESAGTVSLGIESPLYLDGGASSIAIYTASGGQDGYLTATDWNQFNTKNAWGGSGSYYSGDPSNIQDAVNRIAAVVSAGGGVPIP